VHNLGDVRAILSFLSHRARIVLVLRPAGDAVYSYEQQPFFCYAFSNMFHGKQQNNNAELAHGNVSAQKHSHNKDTFFSLEIPLVMKSYYNCRRAVE
jgi:hypothetical protein